MKNTPLISVVIPTFNESERVVRAVESMQKQTYQNLEILVIDDWSTDTTREAVEKIARTDSRVHYILLPEKPAQRKNWRGYDINAGFSARNYGFKIAKGEWITTQDADDASLANRIELQYQLATQYKATLVTIQWQQLTADRLGKKFDYTAYLKDNPNGAPFYRPEELARIAHEAKGVLMIEPIHKYIPFPFKWFPPTRKLFYRKTDPYPGADNCMFFHKKVRDDGVYFRHRNERTWGSPSGRGSGRDFVYRVAALYKNSWSFKIPLYLWDVKLSNTQYESLNTYIR